MKLIIGFGNPGNKYNFTRHNFGFLALDFYAKIHKLDWLEKPRWNAIVAKDEEHDFLLVKPQTFYNDQGVCVKAICAFYKVPPQDILVLCDDFNLPFGKLRFRERGSAGGNNGLKSVIAHLGEDFPRLRLGSGNDQLRSRIGDVDFVLSKFTDAEREQLPNILREIVNFMSEY
jgi:PTH1 family peptidyl-tRNA hydrolase